MARAARPRKKTKTMENAKDDPVHVNGSQESQNDIHLVQDDNVAVELASAYLGSMIIDIRMLSRNSRNRIIDHSFIKKLTESFQLGARRYSQEDRLKVTTSAPMFEELLKHQSSDQLSVHDVKNQTLRKTSVPVITLFLFLSSYHGWIDANDLAERNACDKHQAR